MSKLAVILAAILSIPALAFSFAAIIGPNHLSGQARLIYGGLAVLLWLFIWAATRWDQAEDRARVEGKYDRASEEARAIAHRDGA